MRFCAVVQLLYTLPLLVVVMLVESQFPNFGFCPEYAAKADFDINQFLGKWYEHARYFRFSDVINRCVVADYARAPSGKIFISNEATNRITGIKRIIDGNIELAGKQNEGTLNVKYSTTPLSSESVLKVLDTDYKTFAIIWSCSGLGPIHTENAWVLTRDRLPDGPIVQRAYGVLDKFKISRTFFVKTEQEGCAIAASDINASNGISTASTVLEATGTEQKGHGKHTSSGIDISDNSHLTNR